KKLEQQKAEQEKQKKLAEDKRRKAEEAREAREADARHQANIRRMQGLAGATGGETATGTALRSAGPSGGYGGKVAAKVKPNIVFPDQVDGNPRAEVEVLAAPDGTIVKARITQSSGNKAWDEAVLRALQRTETLPRDIDGRVPSSLVISFRPKD
ncbi:MAG TPA: cell envelope integrity protein TolA, partial [Alicycliphilus sp.]|nr:cell envelope integrity protein TolA [Alicycliphilus sp.]